MLTDVDPRKIGLSHLAIKLLPGGAMQIVNPVKWSQNYSNSPQTEEYILK